MVEADPERVAASLVRIGVVVGLAVAAVQAIAHLTDVLAYDAEIQALSAEVDGNAFAWASSMATLAGAFVLVPLAWLDHQHARRYTVLAALLTFLSLDDVVAFHERLGSLVRSEVLGLGPGFGRVVWPAIFFPLLAATFVLLWERRADAPRAAASAIRLGLVCLSAALATKVLSTPWYASGHSGENAPAAVGVAVGEGLEIFAWTVIAVALAGAGYATLVSLQRGESRHG